jgi:hypothetical protein
MSAPQPPAPTTPTSASTPPEPKKRQGASRGLDITLTIVFLVLNALMVGALFVPALFLAMASDGCNDSCNLGVVQTGFYIALFGPSVAFVVNLVLSIVFLVRKRTSWLMTLLVGIGGLLVFFLGVAIVFVQAG